LSIAQSHLRGAQGRLFSGNYSRFGADWSSGDLLFFQGHGLASGEKAALLSQFSQADDVERQTGGQVDLLVLICGDLGDYSISFNTKKTIAIVETMLETMPKIIPVLVMSLPSWFILPSSIIFRSSFPIIQAGIAVK